MEKKVLSILITILALYVCMFALTACEENEPPHTHVYDQQVASDTFKASDATCEDKTTYHYSCSCGEKGTETFENGLALGHEFTSYVSDGNATCTENGTETATCNHTNCQATDTRTEENSVLGHAYGGWISIENGQHKKTCANDNSHTVTESCSGGTATYNEKAKCKDCGGYYGELLLLQASEGLNYKLINNDTEYEVYGIGSCTDVNIVIPYTYNEKPVTGIGYAAFWDCASIKSVTIGNNITSIGFGAFRGCSSLTSVTMGNGVTSIGSCAFVGCSSLTSVTIGNSVTSIESSAFQDCSSLTSIVIPDSVTSIGTGAFWYCSSLTSVVIPDSVISIGFNPFDNCSSLTYNVKDGVKYLGNSNNPYLYLTGAESTAITTATVDSNCRFIGSGAFWDCRSLTSVTIGNSVTNIGRDAFRGCSSLTNVVIPDSVTSIGAWAFGNCSSLTSVTIGNSVTSIDHFAFVFCNNLTSVYYKGTSSEWSAIEIGSSNPPLTTATRYYYSETKPISPGNYWHYDANGNVAIW